MAITQKALEISAGGCAWRALQTCLSPFEKIPFAQLFHLFGPAENIRAIYNKKYENKDQLPASDDFAPYHHGSGWADPFIAEMALYFYNISANLISVNSLPVNRTAPDIAFHHKPSLNFESFRTQLEKHFSRNNPPPVMLDDGLFALNIIGIGVEEIGKTNENPPKPKYETTLWIADPHIKESAHAKSTNRWTLHCNLRP